MLPPHPHLHTLIQYAINKDTSSPCIMLFLTNTNNSYCRGLCIGFILHWILYIYSYVYVAIYKYPINRVFSVSLSQRGNYSYCRGLPVSEQCKSYYVHHRYNAYTLCLRQTPDSATPATVPCMYSMYSRALIFISLANNHNDALVETKWCARKSITFARVCRKYRRVRIH